MLFNSVSVHVCVNYRSCCRIQTGMDLFLGKFPKSGEKFRKEWLWCCYKLEGFCCYCCACCCSEYKNIILIFVKCRKWIQSLSDKTALWRWTVNDLYMFHERRRGVRNIQLVANSLSIIKKRETNKQINTDNGVHIISIVKSLQYIPNIEA